VLPAFVFEARPVIPIEDAVRVELESIAFRDGPKANEFESQRVAHKQSPGPTPCADGHPVLRGSAVAIHAASRRWLSFGR
jgi:hypothetical protein